MTRTANLINEFNYFNIKLMPIEFGKSKADYTYDKKTKFCCNITIIYNNIYFII